MSDDRELVPGGGGSAALPPGWTTPWGFNANDPDRYSKYKMLWIGPDAASIDDLGALENTGYQYERSTIVGTHHKLWDAPQYGTSRIEVAKLEPCETVKKYGGDGSWTYKSQFLPDEIDKVLCEGKWVVKLDGAMVRSSGGEPVKVVDLGEGYFENHELDYDLSWDADLRVWRT